MEEDTLNAESASQLDNEDLDVHGKPIKMGGGASNFKPWLFQPGQSGNPSGMPKGTVSLKVWARKYIQELTDEEKLKFLEGLPKDIVWRMSEGQPHQSTDTEVKGVLKIDFASDFNKEQNETTNEQAG